MSSFVYLANGSYEQRNVQFCTTFSLRFSPRPPRRPGVLPGICKCPGLFFVCSPLSSSAFLSVTKPKIARQSDHHETSIVLFSTND